MKKNERPQFTPVYDSGKKLFSCRGILPPSINRTYRSGNGSFYASPKQKNWKELFAWACSGSFNGVRLFEDPVFVMVKWYIAANADIDNRTKVLHDGLERSGVISNDRTIIKTYQEKITTSKIKERGFFCLVGPLEMFSACLPEF